MKPCLLISFLLIFFLNENIFGQYHISAIINGKETAIITVVDLPATIIINKSSYKKITGFLIKVNSPNISAAYKRTLEVVSEKEKMLFSTEEDISNPGIFPFELKRVCKKILSKKIINLILVENPADSRMKIPSKMKKLAKVYLN
ncbi:MAG: hypothetical protein Q8891_01610 [Bacteroidota bacterium]|nr:hypothetical protein [Bacteroidota bacterium]